MKDEIGLRMDILSVPCQVPLERPMRVSDSDNACGRITNSEKYPSPRDWHQEIGKVLQHNWVLTTEV